uniref:Xylulose kinase-1 n=1 Tax=Tanacetum cinerariifolium TaxID=118510 RepID=A0A6L2MIE7_TANCI|nr:hypothetical protein [Tanacetum cinerariifolium]
MRGVIPNIYVSCIKHFWNTVATKQVNDVTRLQALVDKKRVVVTEAAIREVLHLDDAEGIDWLPNEEIFTDMARMGYEKPSIKLTFYSLLLEPVEVPYPHHLAVHECRKFNFSKYIFDSLVRNVDNTTKFYMHPRFLQLVIRKQVGDLLTYTTKYALPTLIQKVFTDMKRVGKGFSGVDTPFFEGMLVEHEIEEEGGEDEHVEEVTAGDDAHGDDSAAHGKVPIITQEPSIPSPTPPTPPSQQPQDLPSTSQRVDTSDDTMIDDESNQGRMISEMDKDDAVVLMDDKEEDKKVEEAKVDESAQVQGRQAESQAENYKIDMDHANKVLSMQEDETEPAKVQEVVDVVTTAKLITKVVTAASKTVTAASVTILTAEPQVPFTTLTAAPTRVAAAPSRKRKRSTKRRKLNEEVEYLKRHLEIVPDEDDDVFTKATSLARKVLVVDYEIIELNNKPYYKIIRADGTHQLYISFLTLLKNFDREDLEAL